MSWKCECGCEKQPAGLMTLWCPECGLEYERRDGALVAKIAPAEIPSTFLGFPVKVVDEPVGQDMRGASFVDLAKKWNTALRESRVSIEEKRRHDHMTIIDDPCTTDKPEGQPMKGGTMKEYIADVKVTQMECVPKSDGYRTVHLEVSDPFGDIGEILSSDDLYVTFHGSPKPKT